MTIVDLFIKTCARDEPWLFYCLRQIARHARGFRSVVIATDEDHRAILRAGGPLEGGHRYQNHARPNTAVYFCPLPADVELAPGGHGMGYAWQQAVKLLALDEFTDADAVAVVDSDMMVCGPLTPAMFLAPGTTAPMWWRRPWADAGDGIIHKPAADFFARSPTVFDYMPGPCFYYTREAADGLLAYMRREFRQSPYQYVTDKDKPAPSEYQMVGAYLDHIDAHGYQMVEPRELTPFPFRSIADWPIRQFWSWGGIDAARAELEALP